jgi:PhnB protein
MTEAVDLSGPKGPLPYMIVDDASAAIEFYKAAFGALELVRLTEPGGKVAHAELKIGSGTFMVAGEYPEMKYVSPISLKGSPVSLFLYVDDVDATFTAALALGAKEEASVEDQFDGDRRGTVVDPFGHVWLLATKKEHVTYEEMQTRFTRMTSAGEAG